MSTVSNTTPQAFADSSYRVSEDAILLAGQNGIDNVLKNDVDAEGDALSALLVQAPDNPLFRFNADGTFVFDANRYDFLAAGVTTTETFTYKAHDGQAYSDSAVVTITIQGINDAPVARAEEAITSPSAGAVTIDVLANDTDVDTGDMLQIIALSDLSDSNPLASHTPSGNGTTTLQTDAGGTVSLSGKQVVYTPAAGFFGVDTFQYTVSDGHEGGTATAVVSVTVTPENRAPASKDDFYTVSEDALLAVTAADGVLANDSDPDADEISALLLSHPDKGILDSFRVDGGFSYNPNGAFESLAAGEHDTLTFTYQAADGQAESQKATVTLTVEGRNDPITLLEPINATGAVQEDLDVSPALTLISAGTLAFEDPDLADTHSATVAGNPANTLGGSLTTKVIEDSKTKSGTVDWIYTVPNAATQFLAVGQEVTETFRVTLADQSGSTVSQEIKITIRGTNDVPVITTATVEGAVTEVTGLPTGTILNSTGTFAFEDVDLADTHTVTVTPLDTPLGTLTATIDTDTTGSGTGGKLTWKYAVSDTALEYLADGETRVEKFTVAVNDAHGGSNFKTIEVTLTGTNDAPVIHAVTDESNIKASMIEFADQSPEENTGSHTAQGSLKVSDADLSDKQTVSVTPADPGYLGTFTPSITDNTTEDGSGRIDWSFKVADSELDYLAEGQTLTQVYTVTVDDGHGGEAEQTVTLTLTGTNDGPKITKDDLSGKVTELTTLLTTLPTGELLNSTGTFVFEDVDLADTHTVTVTPLDTPLGTLTATIEKDTTGSGKNGKLTWTYAVADTALEYLADGETRVEKFTVAVNDAHGGTDFKTIEVTLTGTNDAPVIHAVTDESNIKASMIEFVDQSPEENTGSHTAQGFLEISDADLGDKQTVSVTPASPGYLGTFTPSITDNTTEDGSGRIDWSFKVADSELDYLAEGQTLTQVYTVTVDDGHRGEAEQTVTLTLTGTNDGPKITEDDLSGKVTELTKKPTGEFLNSTGTFVFEDVDLADTHTVTVTPLDTPLGTLTATIEKDTTGSGKNGKLTWTYAVADTALEYLADGETRVEKFTVAVNDAHGGTDFKTIEVTLTGTNDAPVIHAVTDESNIKASLTEFVDQSPEENTGSHTAQGFLEISDADLSDKQTVSFTAASPGYLGTFTPTITDNTTKDGSGRIDWSFKVADSELDYLAKGQTLTQVYTVTVDDGHGGKAEQTVTLTLTGTNDGPKITEDDLTGKVTELTTLPTRELLKSTGTFLFEDVDWADTHTLTVTPLDTPLGTLKATIDTDTTGSGKNGQLTWTYEVSDAAIEYLADGETRVEKFTVAVTDAHGGTDFKTIEVTLTGTNDAPVIDIKDESNIKASITEFADQSPEENTGNHTAQGSLPVSDLDLSDVQTVKFTTASPGYLGTFTPTITDNTTKDGSGSIDWSFQVADSELDYLPAGKTLTQIYTVTVDDGHGGTDEQTVTLTLTGTNDRPVAMDDTWTWSPTTQPRTVLANDSDPDKPDTLTVIGVATSEDSTAYKSMSLTTLKGGTVVMAADGTYAYTPKTGFYGTDSFAYQVTDKAGATDTATVNITIEGTPPSLVDRFFLNELGVNTGTSKITIDTDNGDLPNTVTTGVSRIELINDATNAVSTADLRTVQFEIVNPDGRLSIIGGNQLTGLTVDKAGKNINGSAISGNGTLVLYEPNANGHGIWQVYNNTTLNSSGTYVDTAWNLGSDVSKAVAVNIAQGSSSIDLFTANQAPLSQLISDDASKTSLTGVGSLAQAPHALGSVVPFVLPERIAAWYGWAQIKPDGIPQDVLDAIARDNSQFNASLASVEDRVFARVYDRYLASNKGSSVDGVFIDHNDAGDWTYGANNMLTTGFKNAVKGVVANSRDSGDNLNPNQGTDVHGEVIAAITNEDGQTIAVFSGVGHGGAGHDFLYGMGTADTLYGDGGNDFMAGCAGNDNLQGNQGGDVLTGGTGADSLTGGSGKDVFVYENVADWSASEKITDFGTGGINTQVLANAAISGLNGDILRFDLSNLASLNGYRSLTTTAPTGLNGSTLLAGDFVAGNAAVATATHAQFVQDTQSGILYFDADGVGGEAATAVAIVGTAPVTPAGHPAGCLMIFCGMA